MDRNLLTVKKQKMTVCVVDANPLAHALGYYELLKMEPNFKAVGRYSKPAVALKNADWKKIDILVTDIELPGMSGLTLIRQIRKLNPHIRILVITFNEDRNLLLQAILMGIDGYILRSDPFGKFIAGLNEIAIGHVPVSASVSRILLNELRNFLIYGIPAAPTIPADSSTLSKREQEVLNYLSKGITYKEIACRLHIKTSTVHTHIKRIYTKFRVSNKRDAIRVGQTQRYL
jgi:DNA-binding NarL/FixJ family response regulator